ncbi:MAG: PEP-CTERM sorting domain-containing protein [Opitutaceae bacterium]|jgi:hypothetical protein|nr:PEP-CTERM sorting domain-containing protein [Opitutaceae bacterium]
MRSKTGDNPTPNADPLRRALLAAAFAVLTLAVPRADANVAITIESVGAKSLSFRFSGVWPEWTEGEDNGSQEVCFVWESSPGLLKPYTDFLTGTDWNALGEDAGSFLGNSMPGIVSLTGTIAGEAISVLGNTAELGTGYIPLPLADYENGTGAAFGFGLAGISWPDQAGKAVDITVTLDWSTNTLLNETDVFDTAWAGTMTFGWGLNNDSTRQLPFEVSDAGVILGTAPWVGAVPEPGTYAALAGLALLAWTAVRRSRGARGTRD